MPNKPVPAAAEGMPKHHAMTGDSLLDTILAYKRGLADFQQNHPQEDDAAALAYADVSYGPPLARLQRWSTPATTMTGAIEALRLSVDDAGGVSDTDAATRLTRSALAFLEQQHEGGTKNKITQADVDRSNDVIAILDTAAFAVSFIHEAGPSILPRVGGNIGVCLELAHRLAMELNDTLTQVEGRQS